MPEYLFPLTHEYIKKEFERINQRIDIIEKRIDEIHTLMLKPEIKT